LQRDPDDSWAVLPAEHVPSVGNSPLIYRLPSGEQIVWKTLGSPRIDEDASLRFEVLDSSGKPIALEPYMGMLSHAAVLRRDGSIFAHLHPVGNFSMAAQSFFEGKLARETTDETKAGASPTNHEDHSMHHGHITEPVTSVYLPYEFPEAGEYRIWVQLKTGDKVLTAAFDARVSED
jgi:hypothetical protein